MSTLDIDALLEQVKNIPEPTEEQIAELHSFLMEKEAEFALVKVETSLF